MCVRGSFGIVFRYANAIQGPDEHAKTTVDGALLSVSVDMSTIVDGELHLDPLASAIERHKKLFASRADFAHDVFPTVSAYQFPSVQPVSDRSTPIAND